MTAIATLGLSSAEVDERVARGDDNAYVAASSRSAWSIVRANLFTLFNGIIAACFIVLLLLGRWQDALFGLSAIANTVIGSVQEFRAKRSLDQLALMHAPLARVLRDGDEANIPVAGLVLDDIVVLRAGDQVSADAVIVDSARLQLDESMLTGESDAVDKVAGDTVLSGSIVVGGEGTARVSHVGANSYANQLSSEAKKFSLVTSELRASINRVLKWIAWIIGPIALLVLNAQMVALGGWPEAISSGAWRNGAVSTIASVVAMIPLGLVLMTSIAFAVGAVKLSGQKVLVQELAAVEGLARIDLICLDKTGTLTEGDIVFDAVHPVPALGGAASAAGAGDAATGNVAGNVSARGWQRVLAWYGAEPDANATARCLTVPYPVTDAREPSGRIPFSSARKWSAVSFAEVTGAGGTWVLGGPEMVFPAGGSSADSADSGVALRQQSAELAASGRRTLVLAHSPHQLSADDIDLERLPGDGSVQPVVLLTFRESVRSDARETLDYFASQGVAVRIISGDNPHTVAAIAREVGLEVLDGFDARELPDDRDALAAVLAEHVVFGRVTPAQKKNIVIALQQAGHTVAMTGDGVNDALAIKEADIGIAMDSGSAATKAVARIILLDGRFSHLPGVVAEGRQVIANVERVSMLFLTKTAYATALAVIFGAFLLQFPFLPRQLSIVDGLTIGIPSFFLALMPNTRRYIPGFLRRSLSFAIPAGLVIALALALYTRLSLDAGISEAELRTGSTLILAIVGLWILIVLSRPIDGIKTLIIGAMMIGLVLVYSIPLVTNFLELVNPSLTTALLVILISALTIGGIEIVRFVHVRYVRRHSGPPPLLGKH
ncbi:HAD-IC family P-type ATPase [Subtercola lobariae]|uniref:Magnesium-transporting ATPase n=1 Tax=Subtercola lobariae TaxID=1588641 RepID=A0A917B7F4_9MICO|nr:HAD-IC family P-type ATPase [Subtercola lobariae]GGF27642.1 magnesium-transporting ATPase [Subtercola lobariae]